MTRQLLASLLTLMACAQGSIFAQAAPKNPSDQTEAWEVLRKLIASSNPEKRELALNAMSILGDDPTAANILINTLKTDHDPKVRVLATSTIAEGKCRAAIPTLKQILDDRNVVVAFASAKALWDLGDRSGLLLFQEVLSGDRKNSESMIHGALQDAHRRMHEPGSLAVLGVNEVAGIFFGPAGTALSLFEDSRKNGAAGRVLAASLVGKDGSPASQALLENALTDNNPFVAAAACKALALNGKTASLPKLEPMVGDTREPVRAMASAAVIRLTNLPRHARPNSRRP